MTTPAEAQRTQHALECEAYELVRVKAWTQGAVARKLGVSKSSVRNYVEREQARRDAGTSGAPTPAGFIDRLRAELESGAPAPASAPRKVVAPVPEDDDDELDLDIEALLRRQIRKLQRAMDQCNAEGMPQEAQKYSRSISALMHDLKQHEKSARDDAGMLHVSQADIESAIKGIEESFSLICDRPLLCAECGRAVRLRDASANDDV